MLAIRVMRAPSRSSWDKVSPMSFLASRTRSAPQGVGKPVRRREDPRLVTGAGCYTDDVNLPGQAYASMVRSPHAHARIVRIDTAAAARMPGVAAVVTGMSLSTPESKPTTGMLAALAWFRRSPAALLSEHFEHSVMECCSMVLKWSSLC